MASPGNDNIGGLVTFSIKVGGNPISDIFQVYSIEVEKMINRIPVARITVIDGEASTGNFAASSSSVFVPGAEISVEAGYDSKTSIVFKGIITQQSIRINDFIGSALELECRDKAVKMTVGRKSLSFSKQKDSDIISSIIGKYSLAASVSETNTTWPEQIQYYVSDWDFIISRAEANGMIVNASDGKVTVAPPDINTKSVLTIKYGDNLFEFNGDLNSITQITSAKACAWDYKSQGLISGQVSSPVAGPGNLSSKNLASVVDLPEYNLQTTASLEKADLENWCKAQLVKSAYSKIRAEVKTYGNTLVVPANYITLNGIGERFNGDHFVSGVTHTLRDGNWFTELSLGLSPVWFTEDIDVIAPPAAGLLPGAQGLFQGTVKKTFDDPESQYRILVDIPMIDSNGEGVWARLSNFYSTSGAGAFFLPEVGDEVILGFLSDDPRYPIILGSLYSSSKISPFKGLDPNEKNKLKAIVSKSGIYIQFDDEDKVLTVTTPEKNIMVYSDKDKKISIDDQNGNSFLMSESGITMKSPKDINIEADQKINIKGTQGIAIQSSGGDVQVNGVNIKEDANMQFSAQGGTTAQVSSGAELTLKSGMIMIN